MEGNTLLWGIIVLVCGIFISSYGNILFRFVLAFAGFAIGFSLVMWVGGGLGGGLQVLIAIVIGGVLAAVFYGIFRFALYIAGGLLGMVIMLVLVGLFKLGGLDLGIIGWVFVVLAAIAGGFFGHRLGDIIIVLATALTGAYFVVLGLGAMFRISVETDDPLVLLGTSFPLILFLTIALISGLAQYQSFSFRRRVLR